MRESKGVGRLLLRTKGHVEVALGESSLMNPV